MTQRPYEFGNRRRPPAFLLPENRQKAMRLVVAALLGAVAFHAMLFFLCWVFDVNLSLYTRPAPPALDEPENRIVVNTTEPDEKDPEPEPPKELDPEVIKHDEVEPPDIVDVPLEKLDIAPGDTVIALKDVQVDEVAGAQELGGKLDLAAIQKSLPDIPPDPGVENANPIKVNAPEVKDIDMDEWYKDKMAGAGGKDDSMNPDGSKTLQQLLDQPGGSLGADSGYSRLGADLLFEYDKAELKKSALIGLLQLAALMEKNPTTRFIIEGHTDSFGSAPYNKKLSYLRAEAVRQWLSGNGIDLSRVYIRPCGAEVPVVDIKLDRDRQAPNRRVEIHMRSSKEALPSGVFSAKDAPPDFANMPNVDIAGASASNGRNAVKPVPAKPLPMAVEEKAKTSSPKEAQPSRRPDVPKEVLQPSRKAVGAEIVEEMPARKADSNKAVGAEVIEEDHPQTPRSVGAEIVD